MSQLLISQKQRDQICVMLESIKPNFGTPGTRDVEVRMRRDDVDLVISTLKGLTQPATSDFKLLDGWKLVPIEPTEDMIVHGFESKPNEFFSDAKVWEEFDAMSGCQQAAHRALLCWHAMLAAAPDAPHTAQIEPICATGGAEWVKVPRQPTQEMIDAHVEGMASGGAMKAYRQMLAVAPEVK